MRERVQNGELKVEHVSSADQVADVCTKPIARVQFQRLREKLGMVMVDHEIKALVVDLE